eukprot:6477420-Amphidinium_carterae.1
MHLGKLGKPGYSESEFHDIQNESFTDWNGSKKVRNFGSLDFGMVPPRGTARACARSTSGQIVL